ncbi:hypothetical protein SUGI_0731240 [Cryptomeria japonica]|nr:hypothetical protein SUGI_0731240 [Cryptomeria japonica]
MFEIDEAVAFESETIKNTIEDTGKEKAVLLPNGNSKILAKVIEYCNYHVEATKSAISEEDVKKWDQEFVKVDQATLFDLILGANYLNVKKLLDLNVPNCS